MHYIANSQRSVFDDVEPIVDTPGGKVGSNSRLSLRHTFLSKF